LQLHKKDQADQILEIENLVEEMTEDVMIEDVTIDLKEKKENL